MVEIMKMMFLVAFLLVHAESVEGYEFRLSKPNSQDTDGFVEIFYNGSWGLIGNPEFRFSDDTASLLCRKFKLSMFGYGARNIYPHKNTFSHFWLQKLECNGDKESIDDCIKTDEFNSTQFIEDEGQSLQDYGSKLYCVDYRLIRGLSQNTSMLLAAFNNSQHSMCYHGFDSNAGDVVCKHLRYNGLVDFTEGDPGTIPLFNNTLTCTGNESSLNECTMSNAVIENCTRAVYITCKVVRLTTWNDYNDEGTVDIFYNGSWGLLYSAYGFNDVTAKFLCETFGFRNVGFSLFRRLPTSFVGKVWSGKLSCNGTEADIMQCERLSIFSFFLHTNSFTRLVGAYLYCFDFNITSMRLVNGSNSNEGDVELQIGGRWGSIDMEGQRTTSQVKTVGSLVCKILGYVGVSEIVDPFVTDRHKYTWMSGVSCNGNEIDLTDCNYTKGGWDTDSLAVKCEDTDPCQSNPCLNNGTCVDGDRSYTCNCTERWSGINCEIEIREDQTTLIVVLISSIGVLSIVVLATVCCCLRFRREHKKTKTDASIVINSDKGGSQNTKEVEAVQKEMEEGQNNEDVYDKIKENTVANVADYLNPITDVVHPEDADGYVKFADNDQSVELDASNVLISGKGNLRKGTTEAESVPKEIKGGHYNEAVYDDIKENTVADVADYLNPVTDVVQPRDADGYVKFADNDQSVGYYKLKHTKNEEYSKLSGCEF